MNLTALLILLPLLGFTTPEGDAAPDLPGPPVATRSPSEAGVGNPLPASSHHPPPLPHDLHASYGNLGVEGSLAILQLRIFKNDLEDALRRLSGEDALLMEVSPEVDALFLRYLGKRFVLEVDGEVLPGTVVGSGYDELDREPVWTYQVRYDAPATIESARITNTILFEVFSDQRNVVRVVKFPEERRRAYYFAPGEETQEVTFGG